MSEDSPFFPPKFFCSFFRTHQSNVKDILIYGKDGNINQRLIMHNDNRMLTVFENENLLNFVIGSGNMRLTPLDRHSFVFSSATKGPKEAPFLVTIYETPPQDDPEYSNTHERHEILKVENNFPFDVDSETVIFGDLIWNLKTRKELGKIKNHNILGLFGMRNSEKNRLRDILGENFKTLDSIDLMDIIARYI
jgi:hypothetical protein